MCGIVGTVSRMPAAPVVFNALRKLEYRGYDSAGMATVVDSHLEIRKGTGKLPEVEQACQLSSLGGTTGIGHVRWATHGEVSQANAHPHFDCGQKIALVHNGIIENYQELRASLKPGHTFTSQTDTEVVAHLIEEELDRLAPISSLLQNSVSGSPADWGLTPTLEQAVYNVTQKLRGSYALLVISSLEPGKIVAARRDSPLVVGIGKTGNFLASDILCFMDQAHRAIYVEDDEIVVLTDHGVRLLDARFREVRREPVPLDYQVAEVTREGLDSFMLKEIFEQPRAIRRALVQDRQKRSIND
jgi:glutamine---fructose-6-phosphate transaminase (isomerizing)